MVIVETHVRGSYLVLQRCMDLIAAAGNTSPTKQLLLRDKGVAGLAWANIAQYATCSTHNHPTCKHIITVPAYAPSP